MARTEKCIKGCRYKNHKVYVYIHQVGNFSFRDGIKRARIQQWPPPSFIHKKMTFMNLKGYQLNILMDSDSSESHKRFQLVLTCLGTQPVGVFSVGTSQMNTAVQSSDCVPCGRQLCAVCGLYKQQPCDAPLSLTVI